MKRLLIWITGLTILFSSGIALTAQAGIGAPKPAFARWFTHPDGVMCIPQCIFGIQIGITKIDQLDRILSTHPDTHDAFKGVSIDSLNSTFGLNVDLRGVSSAFVELQMGADENEYIQSISVLYPSFTDSDKNSNIPIGISFVSLGNPERVSLSGFNGSNRNYFIYNNGIVLTTEDDPRNLGPCFINLWRPIKYIGVLIGSSLEETVNFQKDAYLFPWAGFLRDTYYRRYYAQLGEAEYPCEP